MRIINIIDRFDKVNFGIWNAAIATAEILEKIYQVPSELWYPENNFNTETPGAEKLPIMLKKDSVGSLIEKRKLNPQQDFIVTHGCWQHPTRWGSEFKKLGFKWVYVPHGMLEPWSMSQKWIQKKLYFQVIEGRLSRKADIVRAVGSPEYDNLKRHYPQVTLIPNGTAVPEYPDKNIATVQYLFMARLHHKKGIIPLVEAWLSSHLNNSEKYSLIIAGPDDGELSTLQDKIKNSRNILYKGAVYGKEKQELLRQSHFYLLPSFSEGFPTSVVEAMSYGLIPIITDGCNFPEAFQQELGIKISPQKNSILEGINRSLNFNGQEYIYLSKKCAQFIQNKYSLSFIAEQQFQLYKRLLDA